MSKSSSGKCCYCESTISKTAIKKHLNSCKTKHESVNTKQDETYFCISVQDIDKIYWMYIDIPVTATLKTLDDFLRKTWLECCGHMSMFDIASNHYSSDPDKDY